MRNWNGDIHSVVCSSSSLSSRLPLSGWPSNCPLEWLPAKSSITRLERHHLNWTATFQGEWNFLPSHSAFLEVSPYSPTPAKSQGQQHKVAKQRDAPARIQGEQFHSAKTERQAIWRATKSTGRRKGNRHRQSKAATSTSIHPTTRPQALHRGE